MLRAATLPLTAARPATLDDPDSELTARAAKGDSTAFTNLVRRHQRMVFHIALAVLHDPDLAMDAAQDTFIRLHANLKGFRGDAPLRTWLSRIALHVAVDHRRKTRRRHEQVVEESALARFEDPAALPDENLAHADLKRRMLGAFEKLNEAQRTILTLRDLEGLAYAQIAKVLRIPVGTVMSRLFYARRALKALLEVFDDSAAEIEGMQRAG